MRRIFVLLFTVSALCFKKINEEESCANPLRMASIGSTPVLLYSDSMHGQTV